MKIYEKAMSVGKVNAKEFTRFANWVRFTQAIVDKNRRSVYSFTNKDFTNRCPKWLPKTAASDITSAVDRFEDLPDDWNTDSPQEEGMEPSCWTIKVCGNSKGLKGGRSAQIVLIPSIVELLLKYRDLKSEVIKIEEENGEFFVNNKNKPLAAMQRTPGSLFDKLGKAVGLTNPICRDSGARLTKNEE